MAIVKISDLEQRLSKIKPDKNGEIVDYLPSIEGKIIAVYPPKEGTGKWGPWKLQNITIQDETGSVNATLSKMETMSELSKGKNIYFECVGGKHGLNGVTSEWNSYTDKNGVPQKKIQLKVTQSCLIKLEGAEFVQSHPNETIEATMLKDAIKAKQATFSHPISQSVPQTSTAPNLVDQLRRYEVLYQMCLNKAYNLRLPESYNVQLGMSETKDIASCMFIQAIRDGLLSQVLIGDFKNPELESNEIPF